MNWRICSAARAHDESHRLLAGAPAPSSLLGYCRLAGPRHVARSKLSEATRPTDRRWRTMGRTRPPAIGTKGSSQSCWQNGSSVCWPATWPAELFHLVGGCCLCAGAACALFAPPARFGPSEGQLKLEHCRQLGAHDGLPVLSCV